MPFYTKKNMFSERQKLPWKKGLSTRGLARNGSDFLVIFCSFCVYSLVPGVWHFFQKRCVKIWAATVWIYPHGFILLKSDTISTAFDFLVTFCSFCVYSLVPGVWHQCLEFDSIRLFSHILFILRLQFSTRGLAPGTQYCKIPFLPALLSSLHRVL